MMRPIAGARPNPAGLAWVLLLGTALLGAGAALHPVLPGPLDGQLAVIAGTPYWRAIHVVMLVGSGLVIIGLWGQLALFESGHRTVAAVIFAGIAIGLTLNASNIAFMAQTGTADAMRYVQGAPGAAAGFAGGHVASLAWARAGNAVVALACAGLAVLLWRDRRRLRVLAALAAIAATAGIAGVVAFDPASREAVAGVALFSVWAAVAAMRALWRGRSVVTADGFPLRVGGGT